MSHTPGPWRADIHKRHAIGSPFGVIFPPKGNCPIATVLDDTIAGYEYSIAESNARLIAAAPDLLEACKEFVRKVDCGEAKSKRSYAQMKSAIEKAEGRK